MIFLQYYSSCNSEKSHRVRSLLGTAFFLKYEQHRYVHACGVRVVFLEHGALFASRQYAPKIAHLSVRFILILFYSSLLQSVYTRRYTALQSAIPVVNDGYGIRPARDFDVYRISYVPILVACSSSFFFFSILRRMGKDKA